MRLPSSRTFGVLGSSLLFSATAAAQVIRPSQPAGVMQWVGATKIDITYHRPVARGRTLFGKLVPFDSIWSPSADTAAMFTTSTRITVNGEALPAGTYSIFTIPGRTDWTVIFTKDHPVHHMFYKPGHDALRVHATPRTGDHLETLAILFPMVDADSAEMTIHWGQTIVPLRIKSAR